METTWTSKARELVRLLAIASRWPTLFRFPEEIKHRSLKDAIGPTYGKRKMVASIPEMLDHPLAQRLDALEAWLRNLDLDQGFVTKAKSDLLEWCFNIGPHHQLFLNWVQCPFVDHPMLACKPVLVALLSAEGDPAKKMAEVLNRQTSLDFCHQRMKSCGTSLGMEVDLFATLIMAPGIVKDDPLAIRNALVPIKQSHNRQNHDPSDSQKPNHFPLAKDHPYQPFRELYLIVSTSDGPAEVHLPYWMLLEVLEQGEQALQELRLFHRCLREHHEAFCQIQLFRIWQEEPVTADQLFETLEKLGTCTDESFRSIPGHELALELMLKGNSGLVRDIMDGLCAPNPLPRLKARTIKIKIRTRAEAVPNRDADLCITNIVSLFLLGQENEEGVIKRARKDLQTIETTIQSLRHDPTRQRMEPWLRALGCTLPKTRMFDSGEDQTAFFRDFGTMLLCMACMEKRLSRYLDDGLIWLLCADTDLHLDGYLENIFNDAEEYLQDAFRDNLLAGLKTHWPEREEPDSELKAAFRRSPIWNGINRRCKGELRRASLVERILARVVRRLKPVPLQGKTCYHETNSGNCELMLIPSRCSLDMAFGHIGEVCIARHTTEVNRPDFIPIRIIDQSSNTWCGSIFTLVSTCQDTPVLVVCGIEPSSKLISRIDPADFLKKTQSALADLAQELGCDALVQTVNSAAWSNRHELTSLISKSVLKKEPFELDRKLKFPTGRYDMSQVVELAHSPTCVAFDMRMLACRPQKSVLHRRPPITS